MKKRPVLILSLLVLFALVCVATGLLLRAYQRQQANRELIRAIKANDTFSAIDALHAHADPNMRDPGDIKPSLRDYLSTLWQQMRGVEIVHAYFPGETALGLAVKQNNTAIVEALLERGARDVGEELQFTDDSPGFHFVFTYRSVLELAVVKNNPAIVQALVKYGWNVNADPEGYTALFAVRDAAMLKTLVDCGANINAKDSKGLTYLDILLSGSGVVSTMPNDPLAVALLDHGAKDAQAMSIAVELGDIKTLKRMFALGWDVNIRDEAGRTPLMIVLQSDMYRDLDGVLLLLRYGASVNCEDKQGTTPLLVATEAYSQHSECVETLLKRGAQIDRKNQADWTPLMVAASRLSPALVQLLLRHGARVNIRTKSRETALSMALHGNVAAENKADRAKVVRMLKAAGAKE